jgi:predicted nuclease of predicted toxin-antitoxin system
VAGFLANENVPGEVVEALRDKGIDLAWVSEGNRGLPDERIAELGRQSNRILVTFDKGFGELVYRHMKPPPPGIVLVRLELRDPTWVARKLLDVIASGRQLVGRLSVLTDAGVRSRPFKA